jgi:hypothetical protein
MIDMEFMRILFMVRRGVATPEELEVFSARKRADIERFKEERRAKREDEKRSARPRAESNWAYIQELISTGNIACAAAEKAMQYEMSEYYEGIQRAAMDDDPV